MVEKIPYKIDISVQQVVTTTRLKCDREMGSKDKDPHRSSQLLTQLRI